MAVSQKGRWRGVMEAARCPFFRDALAMKVLCEGIMPGTWIQSTWRSKVLLKKHLESRCCDCYEKCPIYLAIQEQYEDGSGHKE